MMIGQLGWEKIDLASLLNIGGYADYCIPVIMMTYHQ